jgi:hypothetical protein
MKNKISLILLLLPFTCLGKIQFAPDSTILNSVDGITKEVLNVISGAKGEERNWDWFRHLFLPDATFSVVVQRKDKEALVRTFTLEEFIKSSTQNSIQSSFYEYEIGKKTEEYNGIAHVFQTYKTKADNFEEEGINSIQLVYTNGRWWVLRILWTSNRNGLEIPEKYKSW